MKSLLSRLLICTLLTISFPCFAITKLYYVLRDNDVPNLTDHYRVLKDIDQHHQNIDILIPQAYVINPEGHIYKFVESELSEKAKTYNIALMPLVTDENFNAASVDQFLKDPKAQRIAIETLVKLCKQHHYAGLQIDFEHIPDHDRDAFTQFYTKAANALHAIDCKISAAIVPQRHEFPVSKTLLKRDLYWSGAYDQQRIGAVSDFVVLMTYNQSGGATTPGPTASVPLDREAIEFSLKRIPRKKIFLGIPSTSLYWVMYPIEREINHPKLNFDEQPVSSMIAHGVGISYDQVNLLKKYHHLTWQWDDYSKVHYAVFSYQDFYRYVFVEDADSFKAKEKLAEANHLGGIAVFRLGNEDPNIWK